MGAQIIFSHSFANSYGRFVSKFTLYDLPFPKSSFVSIFSTKVQGESHSSRDDHVARGVARKSFSWLIIKVGHTHVFHFFSYFSGKQGDSSFFFYFLTSH